MEQEHCCDCRHWKKLPVDPNNLTAVRNGECRRDPPHLVALGGGNAVPAYPILTPMFPACGQFQARVEVANGQKLSV